MNCSTPENATMSSNLLATSRLVIPRTVPLRKMLSRPVSSMLPDGAPGTLPSRYILSDVLFEEWTKSNAKAAIKALTDVPDFSGREQLRMSQEIAREFNTIGAKANDVEISQLVVTCKAELEKIREQLSNIE